jgi:hypothetical protein
VPRPQVIKLKNNVVTFDNVTAPAFIAVHQTLKPGAAREPPKLIIAPLCFQRGSTRVANAGRGFS